jgi:hypothetical protein
MVGRLFARMHSAESEPPAIGTTLLPVRAFWGIDEKLCGGRPELRGKVTARVQDVVYRLRTR